KYGRVVPMSWPVTTPNVLLKVLVIRRVEMAAPPTPIPDSETFATAGANASGALKSRTGSVAPSGRSTPRRRIIWGIEPIPWIREPHALELLRRAKQDLQAGKSQATLKDRRDAASRRGDRGLEDHVAIGSRR